MDDVIPASKTVHVSPTKGGKAPLFLGSGGEIHTRIVEEMAATLADVDEPRYLDGAARILIKAARETGMRAGILAPGYIIRTDSVQWFPWLGTRGLLTLELHAKCDGISAECDELSITYKKTDISRWRGHLETVARGERTALVLAKRMVIKTFDKFDDLLTEELLDEANSLDRLDLPGARMRSENSLRLSFKDASRTYSR